MNHYRARVIWLFVFFAGDDDHFFQRVVQQHMILQQQRQGFIKFNPRPRAELQAHHRLIRAFVQRLKHLGISSIQAFSSVRHWPAHALFEWENLRDPYPPSISGLCPGPTMFDPDSPDSHTSAPPAYWNAADGHALGPDQDRPGKSHTSAFFV